MNVNKVPLVRRFSPITRDMDDKPSDDWLDVIWGSKPNAWDDLETKYRVIILADAGAGKTYETQNRAIYIRNQERNAFFIRIEDVDAHFEDAFEVGSSEQFNTWLSSSDEAWFFLDSVDEARLDNPRDFEKAIRYFAKRIHSAAHRAHVVITSRPYAWRFQSDKELVEQLLPFAPVKQEPRDDTDLTTSESTDTESESSLSIYGLKPLDIEDIRQFAQYFAIPNIDRLITEIQRANLLEMASRPFDLEALLSKWKADGELGSRLKSKQHIIEIRLNEIDPGRSQRQPLNRQKAREGARLLAAAVTLSGESGILVPDIHHEKKGIDAEQVLADWEPNDVRALLERGIFNDILYGAVRFRHRETRELLTAEWLYSLLQKGHSRRQIESLLFREQYGEQVIIPRLRPVLSWLILFDVPILERALAYQPEVAVEGGDAAHLPLETRRVILKDIVRRIVTDEDDRVARDNSAIVRIAQQDLSDDALMLINQYKDNDEAIFFLGRLVWQGNMKNCLSSLYSIAADPNRSIYPRIAATRAVSTVGTNEQHKSLWQTINSQPDTIPRRILLELVETAYTDDQSVVLLLTSIEKLPPYEEYETSGLDRILHQFLDCFAALPAHQRESQLLRLCVGLNNLLSREPYHERHECRISKEFTWLMEPANHAVEILINDRASVSFDTAIIEILLKIPAVKYWGIGQFNEYKSKLAELVPTWPELNDTLFWQSVVEARAKLAEKGQQLTDDWHVQFLGHYWRFESVSFPRVLGWIRSREFVDDKLIALSLAFRIYAQSERPVDWKAALHDSVIGSEALENTLNQLLNPPVEENAHWEQEHLARKQQHEKERQERERNRSKWIERLRANPDIVRNPPELPPGEWTNDQYWLLREMDGEGLRTERGRGSDWRTLIDDFGEEVAFAFRDAAIKHWRVYQPGLRSEGVDTSSIPYLLIFAMAGLEFESHEVEGFPQNLTDAEVSHALRYITHEINGFPSWVETMYRVYPEAVFESVWCELQWELKNTQPDTPMHYILQDVVCYAPWIHSELTVPLTHWIDSNPQADYEILYHCFQILENGQVTPDWFAALARSKIAMTENKDRLPTWYALWVDTEPETGIATVKVWLRSMEKDAAKFAAQQFITQLMGSRQDRRGVMFVRNFKTVANLKELCLLMNQYIRIEDDIYRSGNGTYSPTLCDDAQNARDQIFNLLAEMPGKESYVAMLELAQSHLFAKHRPWILKQARNRAEQDADLEPWGVRKIHEFSSLLQTEPTSNRQLFDIGVLHLNDFKEWLEHGNDSLYETYQKIDDETEMRKVLANWINEHARGSYTCAQENPLANDQRPDIWLQHSQVTSPVPIELKLLDKGWSGPKLCERLHNQLAGDYLREETAGCGIFLLVWQGRQSGRRWQIEGKRVDVSELQHALTSYWKTVSHLFVNVSSIEVIVIDLALRESKSEI